MFVSKRNVSTVFNLSIYNFDTMASFNACAMTANSAVEKKKVFEFKQQLHIIHMNLFWSQTNKQIQKKKKLWWMMNDEGVGLGMHDSCVCYLIY